MSSKKKTKNILWAVNPFSEFSESVEHAAQVAKILGDKTKAQIEPVYVMSPDGFNWSGDFSNQWIQKVKPKVKDQLVSVIEKGSLQTLEPTILVHKLLSLKGDTKKMVNYARKSGAQLLVLSTHARTGVSRFVLGSFAETAILHSKVPLMLVNPHCEVPRQFSKAMFATDLSKASKKGFKKFLKNMKNVVSEVVIYHKLPDPIEPVVQTGVLMAGGGWVSIQQYLGDESAKRRKECEALAKQAGKMGIKSKIVVDSEPGFVAEAIVGQTKANKADFVALVSQTGAVSAFLVGSVSRQMARISDVPVYLFHEED